MYNGRNKLPDLESEVKGRSKDVQNRKRLFLSLERKRILIENVKKVEYYAVELLHLQIFL